MKSARRLLSILLAASCFMMAVTGAYIIYRTGKNYTEDKVYLKTLTEKVDHYAALKDDLALHFPEYKVANAGLKAEWKLFEEKSSGHRNELVIYTATKSGIKTGEQQLAAAWGPVASGREQLEAADAEFQQGYDAFIEAKQKVEAGWQQYNDGVAQLDAAIQGAESGIAECNAALAEIEAQRAENPAEPQELPEEYTDALTAYNQFSAGYSMIVSMSGYNPEDSATVAAADAMAAMAGFSSLAELATAMAAYKQIVDSYAGFGEPVDPYAEQEAQLQAQLAQLQATKEMLEASKAELEPVRQQLEEAQAAIDENEALLEEGKAQLDSAKELLAAGEAALYSASKKIRDTKAELAETSADLSDEIVELAEKKDELDYRQAVVDYYDEQGQQLEDAKYRLLNYPEIRALHDSGEEVYDAAVSFLAERTETAERTRNNVTLSGILSIVSFFLSAAGIYFTFNNTEQRLLTAFPPLACFLTALSAQMLRYTGIETMMYSALITALTAAVALVINLAPES